MTNNPPNVTDRETLEFLYGYRNYEQQKIADMCGCSAWKVRKYRDQFGIKRWYKREDKLRKLYIQENLTTTEITDRLNCSHGAVSKHLDKYNIEKEVWTSADKRLMDAEWLREKYHGEQLTLSEIGVICGVTPVCVCDYLKRHNIESRNTTHLGPIKDRATYVATERGYVVWSEGHFTFPVHRLLAIAEFGVDAVKEKVVHHKNGVKWDNRPSNIDIMTQSEHGKVHHEQGDFPNWRENLAKGRE